MANCKGGGRRSGCICGMPAMTTTKQAIDSRSAYTYLYKTRRRICACVKEHIPSLSSKRLSVAATTEAVFFKQSIHRVGILRHHLVCSLPAVRTYAHALIYARKDPTQLVTGRHAPIGQTQQTQLQLQLLDVDLHIFFAFILLIHEGSHPGRSTRNSNPVMTFSAGPVPRVVQTTGSVHPQPTLPANC